MVMSLIKTAYVAGSFSAAPRIRIEAGRLAKLNYKVLSRWFNPDDFIEKAWDKDYDGKIAESMATGDVYSILEADVFIIDTINKSSTGGSETELGIALTRKLDGHNLRIIRIGPSASVFHTLVRETYPDWEAFFLHEACCHGWELTDEPTETN